MRNASSLVIGVIGVVASWALGSTAGADSTPRFEILDRGDAVEIIAHDVKAAKTSISPIRSRLEIPLVGTNNIPKLVPAGDKTIKVIELDGHSKQVLSVKLDFERPEVQKLAKHAQAYQVGNDLHIIFPRQIPVAGTAIALPEPTLSPELAAKAAAIAPVVDVRPEALPEAPKPEVAAAPEPTPEMVPSTGPLIKKTEPAEAPEKKPIAKAAPGAMKNFPILLASILALLGCIVWIRRRKNGGANASKASTTIEIIAQKSLGRNAKLVWFHAGGREMIVSVTAQQVRMLGQWKKSESEGRTIRTPIRADGSGSFQSPLADRPSRARTSQIVLPEATALPSLAEKSSAVTGLLKLRAKTNVPVHDHVINEDVATGDVDADAVWAREILAATGARR
ncbi:MAG: flagellar biosynthetic protein FliO [Kofleriaceae bacterium]